MSPTTRLVQRLMNIDLVMQWTRTVAQRGWYLHPLLGGISVVFALYLMVFVSGGDAAIMSMHVRTSDEIKETHMNSLTGGENVADDMSLAYIVQAGICRYR